jgi:hypothetical protein
MKQGSMKQRALLLFLAVALAPGVILADVTGKIRGTVTDRKTGEPLPGANIVVLGTQLGGSTDQNGDYFILQVPPGAYSVRVSLLGYRALLVENVQVSVDRTTPLSIKLEEQTVELKEEIVTTAERPVIQKDATATTQYLNAAEIARLPVQTAREGVMLQTGVFFDPMPVAGGLGSSGRGETRYAIRGGSQDQIRWYVDGVRTAALIEGRADRGGSFTNVNLNAVQEFQVVTGGFNAEYGDAQSGIVNVVTKEGGERWSGSAEFIYGLAGQHHFGNYIYDPKTQPEFQMHTLADGSLDPKWWTPYRRSQVYDYTKIPDKILYFSLGGPLFASGATSARLFLSGTMKKEAYSLPHPRDTRDDNNIMGNLVFQFPNAMRLKMNLTYDHEAHSTLQETGAFTNQAKYYRGWGSLLDTYTSNLAAEFSHTLSPAMFYEAKLSWFLFDSKEAPGPYTTLGKSANPDIFGYQRYDGYPDEPYDAYAYIYRMRSKTGDVSLTGSLNWQFDRANLLKAGFEYRYNTQAEIESDRFAPYSTDPNLWINKGLNETYHPIQIAAYVQDKMEFESMILNIGVRYDFFDPNRLWFYGNNYYNLAINPDYNSARDPLKTQIDSLGNVKYSFDNVLRQPRTPSRTYHMISPRFGVSFPLSENTVVHFNYGHFYQMPPLDRMFQFSYFRPLYIVDGLMASPGSSHTVSSDGDPERVVSLTREPLKPQKTISFEVGVRHNVPDIAVVEVTGFYKSFTDQTLAPVGIFDRRVYGWDPFTKRTTPNIFYASVFPGDYGDARGFEITLKTTFSPVVILDVNYSFSVATQGRATPARVDIDASGKETFTWDTDVNKRIPIETNFSRPHIVRTNIYLRYPASDEGGLLDDILRGTTMSILYKFVSGQTFTYLQANDPPDTYDNYRYPVSHTVDLRVDKSIRLFGQTAITGYVRITNLLNAKNVQSIGDLAFDPNALKQFVDAGKVTTVEPGAVPYDISWSTWYEPRRVYFGVRYEF